jgi:predicted metal-dependent hydrolase
VEVEVLQLFAGAAAETPPTAPSAEQPVLLPDLDRPRIELESDPEPVVEIRVSSRRRKTVAAHWEGDDIVVVVPQRLPRRERQAYADELSAKLIADRSRRRPTDDALTRRARELSSRYLDGKAVPAAVTWSTRQQHRWGSCSPTDRTIRLSDRLRDVPEWVLDAVIVHELAHLLHAEHDAAFHALISRFPPSGDAAHFLAGYELGLLRSR